MNKPFIKDGIVHSFKVENNKVYTTIELGGFKVTNPSLEQFKSLGWEEYVAPAPEPYLPTIEELTEQKIREKYSINKEFQILRKRDSNPDTFAEYNTYVENCITWAYTLPHRE